MAVQRAVKDWTEVAAGHRGGEEVRLPADGMALDLWHTSGDTLSSRMTPPPPRKFGTCTSGLQSKMLENMGILTAVDGFAAAHSVSKLAPSPTLCWMDLNTYVGWAMIRKLLL